jgi:hypothetical protein
MKPLTVLLLSALSLAACGEAPTDVQQAQPQALTSAWTCNDAPTSTIDNMGTYDVTWPTTCCGVWHTTLALGTSLVSPGWLMGSMSCPQELQANGCWTPWGTQWPAEGVLVYGQQNAASLQLTILPDQVFGDEITFNLVQQWINGDWHVAGSWYGYWDHELQTDSTIYHRPLTFDAKRQWGPNTAHVTGSPIACPVTSSAWYYGQWSYTLPYDGYGDVVRGRFDITSYSGPYMVGSITIHSVATNTDNAYPIFGTQTGNGGVNFIIAAPNPNGSDGPFWMTTKETNVWPFTVSGPTAFGSAHSQLPYNFSAAK